MPQTADVVIPPNSAVAAIVVAHNHAPKIAATVRALSAIPGVDFVLVVDDGSTDNTLALARKAGAVVVRNPGQRGRAQVIETASAVIAMHDADRADSVPLHRAVLIVDGGLGNHAVGVAPLVFPVLDGLCDLTVALVEGDKRNTTAAAELARRAIKRVSEWQPAQPLSRLRCVSLPALEAVMPLARGAGLEVAMTLDALAAGFAVTEVPCDIRLSQAMASSRLVRSAQYRDVMVAIAARRVRISRMRENESE